MTCNIFFPVNAKITPHSLCYPINFVTGLLASLYYQCSAVF
jgi:hypothetical protein